MAEIRSAFNKKLVKLFMPRTIVDFETLFQDCHERISQAFQEQISELNEKFSDKLEKFRQINEKVLINYRKMAGQNQEFAKNLQDQIDQYLHEKE